MIDDSGGTAAASAFAVHVKSGGADVAGSPAAGSATGTDYSISSGDYVVSEDGPPAEYTLTGFSGDCDSSGTVTVVPGGLRTCTITNDDRAATLVVIKHVINDNGGSKVAADWTMNVSGSHVSQSSFAGSESGVTVTLDANRDPSRELWK